MELLPLTFTTGWTSGINAYATVLVMSRVRRGYRAFRRWLSRDQRSTEPDRIRAS